MAEKKTVRATTSFVAARAKTKGEAGLPGTVIPEGTLLPATDPIVKRHPELFQPVEDYVESATANPGEARAVTPPKKGEES